MKIDYYYKTGEMACVNRKNNPEWEKRVNIVKSEFSKLLSNDGEVGSNDISIFHNSTAAIQRIFLILGNYANSLKCSLLTTDSEYPGILTTAYESWMGEMHVVKTDRLIWNNKQSKVLEILKKAFLLIRPRVLFISHVFRSSGYILPLEFVKFVKKIDNRTIIVVDGAQAAGNISIEKELLDNIDFYITSGHKWLNGITTLGLVFSRKNKFLNWPIEDRAQSYSARTCSGGTGQLEIINHLIERLQTINKITISKISEENKTLATFFIEKVNEKNLGLKIVEVNERNGIVAIQNSNELLDDDWGKFEISILKNEPLIDKEVRDRRNRFIIDIDYIYQPVTPLLRPEYTAYEKVYRLCFQYPHTKEMITKFINHIENKINGKTND